MRKLILHNAQSPGDIVMLTAAVRNLHRRCPAEFVTDVRTSSLALWANSPYLTPLKETDPEVETVECHYPLIHQSNQLPYHFIHGFIHYLNERLGLNLQPTAFHGDIHLSETEQQEGLAELLCECSACGRGIEEWWEGERRQEGCKPALKPSLPVWIVAAGGKRDFTIKWWETRRYQRVVDHFKRRILFAQVGSAGHYHPQLENVIDLRGRTNLRQLVRLVHHAQGMLTPVSLLMHLAAAVPLRVQNGATSNSQDGLARACVVIAGGREPVHWEAYPTHQFLHTVGMLPCCKKGGCWRSRALPLGDGDEKDRPEHRCVDLVGRLPRCMAMITPEMVIERIEAYLASSRIQQPLWEQQQKERKARTIPTTERLELKRDGFLTAETARSAAAEVIEQIPPYPGAYAGRGIVIPAGGVKYFTSAWVCINMLRQHGCKLPIQVWHLGPQELDSRMRALLAPLNVECVDAHEIRIRHPARILNGWELKPYAMLHSPFKEVLLLDADNVPLVNPEFLFDSPEFSKAGAVFWPDYGRLGRERAIWGFCGVEYRDEPEFESGQVLVDKERCWRPLQLALWMNEHSDFFYQHIHGDKDTCHLAWRKTQQPYAMPATPIHALDGIMCQHDFEGRRIFQHRNSHKWSLSGANKRVPGFVGEEECLAHLEGLRQQWDSHIEPSVQPGTTDLQRLTPTCPEQHRPTLADRQPGNRIVFRAPIDAYTGYGLHACQIINDLEASGYDVAVLPTHEWDVFAPIPATIRSKIIREAPGDNWELMLHPPNRRIAPGKKTIFFTMWEATRLPRSWVNWLNEAECIVVPCQWNATCFSACGIERPIRHVPLGIDPEVFKFVPMLAKGPCVFGTAGRMAGGGRRKGLEEVIQLFQRAFPTEKNVRLRVKGFPDCGISAVPDSRIDITAQYLAPHEMAHWYASLTCYVSLSRSEGWGLMPHQAMATGRPCIAVKFGGHAEFLSEQVAYCVNYRLVPAQYNYGGGGVWAEPDADHVIEWMRHVYSHRAEARKTGEKAAKAVAHLTWARSNRALLKVLVDFGMVATKPSKDEQSHHHGTLQPA